MQNSQEAILALYKKKAVLIRGQLFDHFKPSCEMSQIWRLVGKPKAT